MSWIIVMLLVLIIVLLSVCIYLDIEFASASASSNLPNTTQDGTSGAPPVTNAPSTSTAPIITTAPPLTTKAPQTTEAPVTTTKTPITSTTPVTTTAAPITTKAPQVSPDAPTICIDPGHGFTDPGVPRQLVATGVEYYEKDINLAISLLLKEELIALGYNVIMTHDGVNLPAEKYVTRTQDGTFFYAPERNQWIKDRKNEIDLVISIHCNSASPSVSGSRFYILPYGANGYTAKSVTLAEMLSSSVHQALGTTQPNKYHTDGTLAVLKTGIPTVLVESLFMSNNSGTNCDLAKLIDPEWQSAFADALAQGVKNYLTK